MQAHTSGEVGNLGTVLLKVYSGTTCAIFIEIGLYLTDKEQKISRHSFFLRHGVFPVSVAISGSRLLLESPELAVVKIPGFGRPYCYFRLSVVIEITVFEIAMVDSPRFAGLCLVKPQAHLQVHINIEAH